MTYRYMTETIIAAVRPVKPIVRAYKDEKGEMVTEYGPEEFHIVTSPPSPIAIVAAHKPSFGKGRRARLILEVDEEDAGS